MSAVSLHEGLALAAPSRPSTWWAPADGSLARTVRDVVRTGLAVAAVLAVIALPGLVDMAMTALLGGDGRG